MEEIPNDGMFESIDTHTIPPDMLIKIYTLQKRDAVLFSIEDYYKRKYMKSATPIHMVKSRLNILFIDLRPALKRYFKPSDGKDSKDGQRITFDKLEKKVYSNTFSDLLEAFNEINDWMDQKGLTKIDNRIKYNTNNAEQSNRINGF